MKIKMKIDEFQVGALGALNTIYSYTAEEAEENYFKQKRKNQQDELEKIYSIDTIRRAPENINWLYLTVWKEMDETFIREFIDYLDWKLVRKYQDVSEDFRREIGKGIYNDF